MTGDAEMTAAIAQLDQHNAAMRDGVTHLVRWYKIHAASGCDQPECAQAQLEQILLDGELDREALIDLLATAARMVFEHSTAVEGLMAKIQQLTKGLTSPK